MKNKKIVIPVIIIIILLILSLFLLKTKKENEEITLIDHKEALKLYENQTSEKCTELPEKGSNTLLYLAFGQMKKDGILKDSITLEDYQKSALKVLKNDDIPSNINGYIYEGYKYTLNGNEITREETTCDSNYVSKIYGYSSNEKGVVLTINSGYVKDSKVYDLSGKEIGDYSKDTINKVLDNATRETYTYIKDGNSYKLDSVK